MVRIFNTDDRGPKEREELVIISVSSESPSFYTSFYRPIAIAPGKEFALEVVFLPRAVNAVESYVTIHTSAGNFVLQVSGRGIPNPYKVQPFVGIKVPVGEAYEPSIEIYNPFYEVLSVREIYTSSSALSLLLPPEVLNYTAETCGAACSGSENSEETSRKLKLWDVAPHTRRSLIKLRFISQKTGKFQGFVNIKTGPDNLIVHVDVSVVSAAVHKTPEELDFGVMTLQDTKTLNFTLLNSGATLLQASELQIAGSSDPNLDFQFQPTTLPPKCDVVIATLTYSARSEGTFKGKLLLRTNDTNPAFARIEVPYRVRVLAGYLSYSTAQTTFASFDSKLTQSGEMIKVDKLEPVTQEILLTNKFSVPLVLFSAEVEDTQLRVVDFAPSQIVEPGESWPALKIEFRPRSPFLLFTTHLHLTTNATLISIPLHICHGKLAFRLPEEAPKYSVGPLATKSTDAPLVMSTDALSHTGALVNLHSHSFDVQSQHISFGTVPVNEVQTLTLNVTNHNPIKLPLLGLWTDVEGLNLKLESVWNAQGYRSVSSVAFQAHRPGIFDEKPSPPLRASAPASSKPSSSSKRASSSPKKSQSSENETVVEKPSQVEKEEVFELLPGHSALFSLELKSTRDTVAQGWIYFATPYERSAINVTYTSFAGKLELLPERFEFEPTLRKHIPLYIEHTYSRSVTITSITSNDARLEVEMPKTPSGSSASSIGSQDERHLWLRPNTNVKFGSVSYRPLAGSKASAELQASLSTNSLSLPIYEDTISESDVQKLVSSIDLTPQKRHNDIRATLTVTTDLRTVHAFPVRIQRWRPTIIAVSEDFSNSTIDFGLVEIETGMQEHRIDITNPLTASPILVQLQLAASTLSSATDGINGSLDKKGESCVGDYSFAKSALKLALLNPGETKSFGPVVYQPSREGLCTSSLYLLSNLTTIEQVAMTGFGGGGRLTFSKEVRVSASASVAQDSASAQGSGTKVSSSKRELRTGKGYNTEIRAIDQLRFNVKDSALKACEEETTTEDVSKRDSLEGKETSESSWTMPVLTKTIVVENKGDLPLFIQSVFLAYPASEDSLVSSWRRSSSTSTKRLGGFTVTEGTSKAVGDRKLQPGDRLSLSVSFSPDFTSSEARFDLVLRSNSSREFRFPLVGVLSEEKLASCARKFRVTGNSLSNASIETPIIVAFVGFLGVVGFVWDRRRRQAADRLENELPQTNSTPSTPTKVLTSSKESTPKKEKDETNTTPSAKSKTRSVEDLENHHSSPTHVAAAQANGSSNKDRKKDKKDQSANHNNASSTVETKSPVSSAKTSVESTDSNKPADALSKSGGAKDTTSHANNSSESSQAASSPATAARPTTPPAVASTTTSSNSTPANSPTNANETKKTSSKSEPEKPAAAAEAIPTSPTSASVSPASQHTSTKKKDKKDKKELWQGKPTEPVFGPVPTTSPTASPNASNKTSQTLASETSPQERKNKKSNGLSTSPPAASAMPVEKQDAPVASNAGQPLSPTRTPSPPDSDGAGAMDSTEAGRISPQPAVRQTLVPAKRPSSKPLPKYARKDGLGKDTIAPVVTTVGATPAAASTTAPTAAANGTVAAHVKPAKESKKNRPVKEYKQKQPLSAIPSLPVAVSSTESLPAPTAAYPNVHAPVPRVPESGSAETHKHLINIRTTPPPSAPIATSGSNSSASSSTSSGASGTKPVPSFPGGTLAQLHEFPALGSNFSTSSSSLGPSSAGSSSPAAFTNPLLVSPGSLSASRYDYGRGRGLSNSGSFAGGALNFDFSNAPSFDNGVNGRSISRESSATPPTGGAAGTPPLMRWYNPMAPGNGSVENLLASFADGTASFDGHSGAGSASSAPGDGLSFFGSGGAFGSSPLLASSPTSTSSSVDWSSTGPIAPGVGSAWNAPTTDRAVEENASNLSMLGLGAPRQHRQPNSGYTSPDGSRSDGATSPFFLGLHNVSPDSDDLSSMESPSVPPGLNYGPSSPGDHSEDSTSHLLGPSGPYTSMPPNSPFSHLSFFSGSNLDDPDFF